MPGNVPLYQVDAFTDQSFKGNPAAVCLLPKEYDAKIMQAIAAEMNLSETAFILPLEKKTFQESINFSLRWFTPEIEVPLCGHATLATAAVLFHDINVPADEITFQTKSGTLTAVKQDRGILLNFPANKPDPIEPPSNLINATRANNYTDVRLAQKLKILLIQLPTVQDVKDLQPDFAAMTAIPEHEDILGVVVTAKGKECDFVSRFFCPWAGINEDPVTGAAHTVLTPYWAEILKKQEMSAYQASTRGGKLTVRLQGDRVNLIGQAVIVMKGELYL